MTVCIAALCRDESGPPTAVVAADRMVTLGSFIEFEHAVPKMAHPSPFAVAMIAGDTLIGTRVAQEVAGSIAGTNPLVVEIAQRLASHYENTRNGLIESQILSPRGLSLQSFYGAHASLNGQITMMIDSTMAQYDVGVSLLLAGVDAQGAHIYTIENPGRPERQHDIIGYAATGVGQIHALQSMIGFGHTAGAGIRETVFRVYASKRRAEVAPGVGKDTDMAILSYGGLSWLDEEMFSRLAQIYESFQNSTSTAIEDAMSQIQFEAPTGAPDPAPTDSGQGSAEPDAPVRGDGGQQ